MNQGAEVVCLEEYRADRIEEMEALRELLALRALLALYDRGELSATHIMRIVRAQ